MALWFCRKSFLNQNENIFGQHPPNSSMMLEGKETGGLLSVLLLSCGGGDRDADKPWCFWDRHLILGQQSTALERSIDSSPQVGKYNYLRIGKKRLISVSALFSKKRTFSPMEWHFSLSVLGAIFHGDLHKEHKSTNSRFFSKLPLQEVLYTLSINFLLWICIILACLHQDDSFIVNAIYAIYMFMQIRRKCFFTEESRLNEM